MESLIGVLLLYISLTRVLPAYGVVGGPPITTQIKWISYLNINTGGKDPAICGATLIDRSWLLTAAHCVTKLDGSLAGAGDVKAYVGVYDLSDKEKLGPFQATVKDVHRHPTYNDAAGDHRHDVALVELASRPASDTPIPFYKGDAMHKKALGSRVLGFGIGDPFRTKKGGRGEPSKQLREASLTLKGWATESACPCPQYDTTKPKTGAKTFHSMKCDRDTQLCAAGAKIKSPDWVPFPMFGSPCAGDSGGPLLVKDHDDDEEFLYGVYSYSGRVKMPKMDVTPAQEEQLSKYDGIIYCGGAYSWSDPELDYPISMFTAVTAKAISDWTHKVTGIDFLAMAHTTGAHGNVSDVSLS